MHLAAWYVFLGWVMGVRGKREGIFFITKNYLKTNRFPKLWNSNGETNLYTSQGIPFFQHQSDTRYQYLLVFSRHRIGARRSLRRCLPAKKVNTAQKAGQYLTIFYSCKEYFSHSSLHFLIWQFSCVIFFIILALSTHILNFSNEIINKSAWSLNSFSTNV